MSEFYDPRVIGRQGRAIVGAAPAQLDAATALLVILTPDGVRHEVEVSLYPGVVEDSLIVHVDTLTGHRDVEVCVNDALDPVSIVGAES